MKIVVFGLAITSSWGNGHATLWRALWRALVGRGHQLVFFEKDVPYYAAHRDLVSLSGGQIVLYEEWNAVAQRAMRELFDSDVAIVTSFCPDGVSASRSVLDSRAQVKCFYDLDTPVTLDILRSGEKVSYLPEDGLGNFDVVLSYTGGEALRALKDELGARNAHALYGSVDPDVHRPVQAVTHYTSYLSYLGTYAEDRQDMLFRLFVEPARLSRDQRFLIGGAQYPASFPWTPNIFFVQHLPPGEHPSFFCSSVATLNVTRGAMARMGYCPSGRLFEAAACGTPIISDAWNGLNDFFEPGVEIATAQSARDVIETLTRGPDLLTMARRARERTLDQHTATSRAIEFEHILETVGSDGTEHRFEGCIGNALLTEI